MRKPKVSWTDSELNDLAEMVAISRIDEPAESFVVLAKRAQELFPPDRRRCIAGLTALGGLIERVKQQLASKPKPLNIAIQSATGPVAPLDFRSFSIEELMREVFSRCQKTATTAMPSGPVMPTLLAPGATPVVQSTPTPQPVQLPVARHAGNNSSSLRKLRIAIVGLRDRDVGVVESRVNGAANLSFIPADRSSTDLSPVDHLVITRFARHRWYYAAKQQIGGDRVHRITGGLTNLLRTIGGITGATISSAGVE